MRMKMSVIAGVASALLGACGAPATVGLQRPMLAVGDSDMKPATEAWLSGGSTIFIFEQSRQSDPPLHHALNIWNYSNSRKPHPVELAPGTYLGGPKTDDRGALQDHLQSDGTLTPFAFTWIDLVVTEGRDLDAARGSGTAGQSFTADVVEIVVTDAGSDRIAVSYRGLAADGAVLARGSFEAPRDLDDVFLRTETDADLAD